MASTHKHIRSSTANKRPTTAIADGQIALNTNSSSPGLFFKDSTGATIIKVGPVHIGATAPNATPPSGGSSGNSTGEVWLDTSLTPNGVKIWDGSAWVNATPIGSTTVQGLLELATNAETQTGSDTARAVTPAGLQSKLSDSTSTTSSTTIASSTAVKAAYDLANAALPKTGGTITGNLEIGNTGSLSFEGATADGFETTIAVTDPTADRTITLPDTTGTVVTTGDTGTVTSTMIADGTIVNGDINASAAIAHTKLANITAGSVLMGNASNIPTATAITGDVTVSSSGVTAIGSGKVTSTMIADGTIVNADISATAEIAVSKLADGTARQLLQTDSAGTGVEWASNIDIPGTLDVTGAAVFDSSATVAGNLTVDTNTLFVDSTNNRVAVGTNSTSIIDTKGFNANALISKDALSGLVLRTSGNAASSETLTFYNDYIDTSLRLTVDHSTIGGVGSVAQATFAGTGLNSVAFNADTSLISSAFNILDFRTTTIEGDYVYLNTLTGSQYATFNGTTQQFSVTGGSASAPSVAFLGDLDTGIYSPTANTAAISTGGSERLRIDSSGRVGIGTTAPNALLEVSAGTATSTNGVIRIAGTNTNGSASNFCELAATQDVDLTSSALTFSTRLSGTLSEKARIDKNGRLLVGTSTARSNFSNSTLAPLVQVEGANSNDARLQSLTYGFAGTDGPVFAFGKHRSASIGGTTLVSSDDQTGWISFQGSDGTEFVEAASIRGFVDGTPGANDMPGRLVFSTTADGASSATEQLRITSDRYVRLASGTGGIQFNGDTAAANALDDYEEGTFTPTIVGLTTAGTGTYTTQAGHYTKIGRTVTFTIQLAWSAHTGSGNAQVQGLPFTSLSTSTSEHVASVRPSNFALTASNVMAAFVATNATVVSINQLPVGGGAATSVTLDTSASLFITGTYQAT